MNVARTTSKNTLVLVAGYLASNLLKVVYIAALSRYVGVEGIGEISTATAIVSLSVLLVNFGLDTLAIRDIAADESLAARYITSVAFLRCLLSLLLFVILALIVSRSRYSAETQIIIAIYAVTFVLDAFSDVTRSVFQAFRKMEYDASLQLARDVTNIGLSLLGVALHWPLVAIVMVSGLASLLKLLASVAIMQRRFARLDPRLDIGHCWQLLKTAVPFAALLGISVASGSLSTVVLSAFDSVEAVGIYSAAVTPVAMLLLVPTKFMESIFPTFSDYHQKSAFQLARSYQFSYKAMLVIGFPLGAGTILVSSSVIQLIYGGGFESAAMAMNVMAVQLFTMVGYVNGAFMNATNRQTLFAVLRAADVGLIAALSFVLIPTYGFMGAALAMSIPALVDFGLYSTLCHRFAGVPLPWGLVARVSVATAVMSGVCFWALGQGANVLAIATLLAPGLYILGLVALRVLSNEEWQFVQSVVPLQRVRAAIGAVARD